MWADAGPLVTALGPITAVLILIGDLVGFGLAQRARRRGFERGKYRGRLIPVTFEWGEQTQEGSQEEQLGEAAEQPKKEGRLLSRS